MVGHLEKLELGLRELRRTADVELHERVDLRAWTALGVGGIASLVARCHSENGVGDVIDLAASHGIGWVVLGSGSRLVAPDAGLRVPVISLTGDLARWEAEMDGLVAGGGANLAQVCRAASRAGLSGLELGGEDRHSVGGLIRAISSGVAPLDRVLDWVELVRPGSGVDRWRINEERPVPAPDEMRRKVVTRVRFRLRPAGIAKSRPVRLQHTGLRALRSVGPAFLDTEDASAADLLSEVGLANTSAGGVRFGGTKVNELLAGRSATATDILDLCRRVRDRVAAATGVTLETALVFVDEDGREISL